MQYEDYFLLDKSRRFKGNRNLRKVLVSIALKYGYVSLVRRKNSECQILPKKEKAKELIKDKCKEYFGVVITKRQINYMLNPQKRRVPYTAVIILETIYNLLTGIESDSSDWKNRMKEYLDVKRLGENTYEKFMVGDAIRIVIANFKPDLKYNELYRILNSTYREYEKAKLNITMYEILLQELEQAFFTLQPYIPDCVTEYQKGQVYIRD